MLKKTIFVFVNCLSLRFPIVYGADLGFDSKVNDRVSMPGNASYPVKVSCRTIIGAENNYAFAA